MARFYRTSVPDFVDDFMYQPPWEIIEKAMTFNEQGIQNALANTKVFDNLEIQHLNDPILNAKVEEIKNKYSGSADEIASNIQSEVSINPQAWKKYLPQISNLQSEFQKDFTSGDIAKMQRDYANRLNFEEINKDIKESNPELYYSALNSITEEWAKDPERKSEWVGERLSNFDINDKEIIEGLKDFEAEVVTQIQNGYITETKYKDENAIVQDYVDTVFSNPKAQQFLQQAIKYKLPGFVDKNGNPIPPEIPINKITKEPVSFEEYNKEVKLYNSLTEEERAEQGRDQLKYEVVLNPDFAWTKTFQNMGERLGGVISQTVKADPVQAAREKRAWEANKMVAENELKKDLLSFQSNLEKGKERIKKQKENNAKVAELEEQRSKVKEDSPRYKKLTEEINTLRNNNVNILSEVQTDLSYNDAQRILYSGNTDPTSPVAMKARAVEENITREALAKELNLESQPHNVGELGLVAPLYDSEGNRIPDKERDKTNIIHKTFIEFNGKFDSLRGVQRDEAIANYISEKFGISKEKLRVKERDVRGREFTINTLYFKDILNGLENVLDQKKKLYENYNAMGQEDVLYPITDSFREKISNHLLRNSDSYSVKRTNGKGKVPSLKKLVEEGSIDYVTNQSPWGESPVITYNGETYYVANHKGSFKAFSDNRYLYDEPEGYVNPEDYENINYTLKSRYASTVMNTITELFTLVDQNIIRQDPKNKSKEGKPLNFVSAPVFLGDKGIAYLRYYPDSDKGYKYTLVDSSEETLYNFASVDEIAPTLDEYVGYKEEQEEITFEEFN